MHLKYLLQSHLTLNEVYLWRITNLMWVSTPCNEFYSLFVCLFLNSPYLSTLLTCCCDCECWATKKFNCLFFIRFSSSVIKQFVFFSLISFILSLNTFSLNVSVFMQKQPINNRLVQSILGRLFWCSCTSQIAQINRSPNWRILWSTTWIEKKIDNKKSEHFIDNCRIIP